MTMKKHDLNRYLDELETLRNDGNDIDADALAYELAVDLAETDELCFD